LTACGGPRSQIAATLPQHGKPLTLDSVPLSRYYSLMADVIQPGLKKVRVLLGIFIIGLVIAGVTAIPVRWEAQLLAGWFGEGTFVESFWPAMAQWLSHVARELTTADRNHPFLFYGTDWLAYAHFVIAIAFIPVYRDPVRHLWVIEWGLIASVLVLPTALLFGPIRGIPWFWIVIDCLFGLAGIVILWPVRRWVKNTQ
jgi:hypothetical protein